MAFMLSVVTPIYNEAENLHELHRRLAAALDAAGDSWEVIFVDDGSTDASSAILARLHQADGRVRVLRLSRNFGHQPAISAGIHHASGDAVILIDGDLQDPPELIGQLVEQWRAGHQIVLAQRRSRPETGLRGLGMRLFYPLMRYLADHDADPTTGIFSLLDRAVVDQFNALPERNRFIPGLRNWMGFRRTSVLYDRHQRSAGRPKQTLPRLVRYAFDGIFSFSYKPLRLATWTGFIVSAIAFILAVWYLLTFFAFHKQAGSGFTTIILCLLFLGGVQLVCIGILGEYIARIYEEVKQRPLYVVAERWGFASPHAVPPHAPIEARGGRG